MRISGPILLQDTNCIVMHCVNHQGKWSMEMTDNGVASVFRKLLVGRGGGGAPHTTAPPHPFILQNYV